MKGENIKPRSNVTLQMPRRAKSSEEKKNDSELGKRLARLRKERGFTQVELAEKTNVIQSIISDHERGKLRPNHEMIVKIATALQISTDELLGLEAPTNRSAPLNRRFLRRLQALDQLPKRDQEALLRTIDAFLTARKAG